MKKTLVVLYRSFNVGGIETNMFDIMFNAIQNNRKVIWVADINGKYDNIYREVFEHPNCERININYSSLNPLPIPDLKLEKEEELFITVFDIRTLFIAFRIRNKYKNNAVQILYLLPLFTGSTILPDQDFRGVIKKYVASFSKRIYEKVFLAGSLFSFSYAFFRAIESHYCTALPESEQYVFHTAKRRKPFDEASAVETFKSDKFRIISAGRFEFPHKGFLLGLIDVFARLKPKHENLELIIIGDGPDKDQVISLLKSLPEETRSAVTLMNPTSPDKLVDIMKKCNLNISVAGCATLGARHGIPTLPARHYHRECEVYGFIPESMNMTTETIPGLPVDNFIERAMKMSLDEYLTLARNSYDVYQDKSVDLEFPFNKTCDISYTPRKSTFIQFSTIYLLQRLRALIKRI